MKRAKLLAALGLAACGIGTAIPLSAKEILPLAYMRAGEYRDLSYGQKVALAQEFMRSFCGSLTMPIVPFVHCVDDGTVGHSTSQPIFDDLKTCVRTLS